MSFALHKFSSFMRCHLSILDIRAWSIGVLFMKFLSVPKISRLFFTFFSIGFSTSGFMLRSLIHVYLSFVQGNKYVFIITFLHRDIQLYQPHLLEMLYFSILYYWLLCHSSSLCKCVVLLFGLQFYSSDQHFSFCTNIMQF